jgi:hypothetical protein
MKNCERVLALFSFVLMVALLYACGNKSNNSKSEESQSHNANLSYQNETEVEIPGRYAGIDNVGMESTIILQGGGLLIIQASLGDGTPSYGRWTGTAENLSLYQKDDFGNDELIGNAKVTQEGLQIIGGKFYDRQ